MATTTAADLIVPEVWGDTVMAEVKGRAVMIPLAKVDSRLQGQPGDTINFPKYGYIGDADELTEGVPMDTAKLSQTMGKATIKEVGKAIELTDTAQVTALGSPREEGTRQIATAVRRKMDGDLRTALAEVTAADAPNKVHASAPMTIPDVYESITWEGALTEAISLFGDEYQPEDMAAWIVHSHQHTQLLRDPNFIDATKFGAGATLIRGQIGVIGQVPVLMSDRATRTGAGTEVDPYVYTAALLRKEALGLSYKRQAIVETDRDILARTDLVTTNVHYAVKRLDDSGVVLFQTK